MATEKTAFNIPSRYPLLLILLALLLSVAGVIGTLRLHPDARIDLLADPNSAVFKDQALFADTFGADPVVIMAQPGPGASLITPDHIVGLSHLEGKLHQAAGVKRVYGPGTLVNTLAISTTTILLNACAQEGKAAEGAARQQAAAAGKSQAEQDQIGQQTFQQAVTACAQRYAKAFPSLGVPAVNDPTFIAGVLLEPDGQHVRPFWNWALPDAQHAVITVRLTRNASLDQVRHIVSIVNGASSASDLSELHDLRFVATGSPVLTLSVADAVFDALKLLLPLALLAVVIVALLALGGSMVLTLVVAALAALWSAGIAGFLGLPVTPATLVVLPVVLGLATDYFIQSVNRIMDTTGTMEERVELAAQRILPSTGLAAAATAAGMLAFVVSSIPLVRQFGLFMAIGVVMAYLGNYLVGLPLLLLTGRRFPRLFGGTPIRTAAGRRIAAIGTLAPRIAIGLAVVGLIGWAALPLIKVETDPARLMPAGDRALAQADQVRREIGIAGEIDLVMQGGDPSASDAVKWLDQASGQAVQQSGHDLKALQSLPGFLAGFNQGKVPDASTTGLILGRIPSYFTGAVVDKSHGLALSIFGLTQVTSVERDQTLLDQVRRASSNPPSGYRAFPAGLAVIAVLSLSELQADQLRLTLLAIALILLVLLAGYRRIGLAVLAILPTVVAAGAATGLLFLISSLFQTRSSPITILLGGVVVAFATEFSVLWLARYRSERANGIDPLEAAHTSSARVGPAIAASALALVAGFAVLAISGVPTVRDFGIWSSLDLLIATAAVFALLPPLARRWYR
ncbi:MAG TPA: MMPL family transporter [Candidatus Dormibacteraeota bacterium]|nr:MMPL family transporter [Candidatus Dormibacteraeota bacterium]